MISIRYIVNDLPSAVKFYCKYLDFKVDMQPTTDFARISRDNLQLYLNTPGTGAGGTAGGEPTPGGWNRFRLEVEDLENEIEQFGTEVKIRGEIVEGKFTKQVLVEDPSGNLIELSQSTRDE